MTPLTLQHVKHVWSRANGDVRHSQIGLITGMGMTPDGFPVLPQPARLLLRSLPDSVNVDPDNVVGMALPKRGTITTASGVNITSSQITEAAGYWAGHELVMTSGTQQGEGRRINTSGTGTLTLERAFDSDPSPSDDFWIMPQRVSSARWVGHDTDSFYYYAGRSLSQLGILGRVSRPVRVEFDNAGDLQGPSPNPVRSLHVSQQASGKFRLVWQYASRGQGAFPAGFRVYSDNGTGTIDYNTPLTDSELGLDVVAYAGPGRVYQFMTPAYSDGQNVKFAVVARNAAALEQLGGGTVSSPVTALGDPPPSPQKIPGVGKHQPI